MNLITNPGFDDAPDFAGWTKTASGVVLNTADARSLPNSAELTAAYFQILPVPPTFQITEGKVSQEIDALEGQVYVLSAWVKNPTPWGPVVLSVKGVEIARVDEDTAGEWSLLAGLWTADATGPAGVAIQATRLGTEQGLGTWLVDDVEVAMARGGYIAYSALITALKQITTANGYYHNVGSRVYPKLVRPDAGLKVPFICVIPEPEQPVSENRETYLMARWRFRITMFVSGSESMAEATSTTKAVLEAYDDLVRATKPWSTGGVQPLNSAAVADVTETSKEIFAGVPDGYSYGEATMVVDLSVPLTDANLGPSGT